MICVVVMICLKLLGFVMILLCVVCVAGGFDVYASIAFS